MAFFDYNNGVGRARFYFAVRWYLHQNRRLLHLVQILRAYLVLGPLRNLLVKYYQTFGHTAPLKTEIHPDFPQGDPTHIVTEIHERGYAHVGQVPAEEVTQILDYCRRHQHTRYWNPHTECEAVNRLCRNATLVEIARRYLGAEPILWLTLLRWSFPLADERADFHPAPHQEPRQYNTHAFHYDILDFKSLTLFVYLTDVESASGAHIVVEGTHNKRWHELHHLMLDDRVVEEKFGERIHVIMGKKGTAFFEETSTYHKVEVCQSRRLILSIDYVLQRTPPPSSGHGRRRGRPHARGQPHVPYSRAERCGTDPGPGAREGACGAAHGRLAVCVHNGHVWSRPCAARRRLATPGQPGRTRVRQSRGKTRQAPPGKPRQRTLYTGAE